MQMYQQHAPCGSKFSIRFMSFTKEDFVFIKKKMRKDSSLQKRYLEFAKNSIQK